jgi:hypothetical protein
MTAKVNARATRTSARRLTVPDSELWVVLIDKERAEFEAAATLLPEGNAIAPRGMRRRVVRVRNWGWVVTLPATKKIGAVLFVPRSKRAHKSVRFGLGFSKPALRVTLRKHLVTYVRL